MAKETVELAGGRRRCKSKVAEMGFLGCASRNAKRSRRRSELEVREEKDLGLVEEIVKPRKSKHNMRLKKENQAFGLVLARYSSYLHALPKARYQEFRDSYSYFPLFLDILKARAALPIASLKGEILLLSIKNDILIVCGETGYFCS